MGFIAAGLLKGLGAGLTAEYEKRREDALIALRRQYQTEDADIAYQRLQETEGRAETRAIAADEREANVKTGLLVLAQKYKKEENETAFEYEQRLKRLQSQLDKDERTHQGSIDAGLRRLDSKLKLTEAQEAAKIELENDIKKAGQVVDHWAVTSDGKLVGVSSTGQVIAKSRHPGSFNPPGSSSDDEGGSEGGSISAARARRDGTAPPPKPAEKPAAKPKASQAAPNYAPGSTTPPPDGKVGRTITGPGGKKAYWNGKVWVLMHEGNADTQKRLLNGG